METARTTVYMPGSLRADLKALAAARRTTLTALLIEGAELVLARQQGKVDRDELRRRALEASRRLGEGLYEGEPISQCSDDLLYGPPSARR